MYEVKVGARSIEPFAAFVERPRLAALQARADGIRHVLGTRAIWNINSTRAGGGVAEMLLSSLRYAQGLGIAARWLVLEGPPEFFRLTKRLHNALHGSIGDGSPLGPEQAAFFEHVTRDNLGLLDTLVREGDIVICHDPQTAGLVTHLTKRGAHVVWRCHIGHEHGDAEVERGWHFLRPYLEPAELAVFSRLAYAPAWIAAQRTIVLPPNIDPFSVKNQQLSESTVTAILAHTGLVAGERSAQAPVFTRDDASVGRVDREAEVIRLGAAPRPEAPLVVQVSRWDAIKDPIGVLEGFARMIAAYPACKAELVLAGPSLDGVSDDPESAQVFATLERAFRALPHAVRRSVHLALLPMQDAEENAAIVNALQRHAAVIAQKSLYEGFGLTVTEAMWKRRPVVASAVGGIADQIRDDVDGLLVHDPTNLNEFAELLRRPLQDRALAQRLGDAGYARVCEKYLTITALEHWAMLLEQLLGQAQSGPSVAN
jgi:trehalose synthase